MAAQAPAGSLKKLYLLTGKLLYLRLAKVTRGRLRSQKSSRSHEDSSGHRRMAKVTGGRLRSQKSC